MVLDSSLQHSLEELISTLGYAFLSEHLSFFCPNGSSESVIKQKVPLSQQHCPGLCGPCSSGRRLSSGLI